MWKRIVAPIVAVAATAGLVAGGMFWSSGTITLGGAEPEIFQTRTVKAKDLTLVCPGSAFSSSGGSGGNAASFQRIGSAVVDYSTNLPSGVVLKGRPLSGQAASRSNVTDTGNQVQTLNSVSSLGLTVADQLGKAQQGSALASAQSFEIASSNGVTGALGANCQNPSPELWLVGGVTTIGREALLILANPTDTDATVDLQLFGDSGIIDGAGLNGISVSANRTVVLPLAGFAPDQSSLTVHVISRGAAVASWIQERTVRGTVSAGADFVPPAVPASTSLVIPGLLKRGTDDATTLISGNGDYSDLSPSIQVFVPGAKDATVTVQVIGSNAKSTGTVLQQQIRAGSTASLDIGGLKDGDYSVFVIADQPVQAAVKLSRTKKGATPVTDFAWLPAVASVTGPVVATAPKSGVSKISIANGSLQDASVTVKNLSDGTSQTVKVSHLGSAVLAVTAGGAVQLSSDQPVSATMVDDFAGSIVAIPLQDFKNSGGKLGVLVR
jgi:Family of unknown function (DUF5719)